MNKLFDINEKYIKK